MGHSKQAKLFIFAAIISISIFAGFSTAQAQQKTFTVKHCTEDDLNKALAAAQSIDTIKFACDGVISFTNAKKITQSIIIDASDRQVTFDGQSKTGLLEIGPHTIVNLKHLTLAHAGFVMNDDGQQVSESPGHAIFNEGRLIVEQSTFTENTAFYRRQGAIENYGFLTIVNSYFEKNQAGIDPNMHRRQLGGALFNFDGSVTIMNSAFVANEASVGSAVYNHLGAMSVDQSLFTKNVAGSYLCRACSGAIVNGKQSKSPAMLVLENTTIYDNKMMGLVNFGTATVINSTLAQNIYWQSGYDRDATSYSNVLNGGVLTFQNSIIASGLPGFPVTAPKVSHNCGLLPLEETLGKGIIDGGSNLQYPDTSCSKTIPVADPKLLPLNNFGSVEPQGSENHLVQTLGLQAGSPAINQGRCLFSPSDEFDGRGFWRATDGKCDIGAFEYGAAPRVEQTPTLFPTITPTAPTAD